MRGKRATKRAILPDPHYQSVVVAKFINTVMERGKKTVARKIVYGAFEVVAAKTKKDPRDVFEQALKNVSPTVEVRSRRVGGANYQIPVEVRPERRQALGFRWLIEAAQHKKGRPMHLKLADELLAAAENQGEAVKKREDVLRMAEANRAFAHFA